MSARSLPVSLLPLLSRAEWEGPRREGLSPPAPSCLRGTSVHLIWTGGAEAARPGPQACPHLLRTEDSSPTVTNGSVQLRPQNSAGPAWGCGRRVCSRPGPGSRKDPG